MSAILLLSLYGLELKLNFRPVKVHEAVMNYRGIGILFFFQTLFLLFALPACASGKLSGRAFSDNSKVVEMPEGWVLKTISPDATAEKADLHLTLDQHLYPALLPLINEFASNENLKISVKEGTCGISAGMLARKQVDMGGFCCPPGAADRLPGLEFHTIGISSLAILVNRKNPIDNVTVEEARKLFQGRIFNWNELKTSTGANGPDMPVRPVGRLHCKARPGHWRLILDNEDLFSPKMIEVGSIADMMSQVYKDSGAVGYEVLWNIVRYKKADGVKALKINGVDPADMEAMKKFKYPFYRVYNVTTWSGAAVEKPVVSRLVEYIKKNMDKVDDVNVIVPAAALAAEGWLFADEELVGEPQPEKSR